MTAATQTSFTTHDISSAPEGSRDSLKALQDSSGFLPNLISAMAESPATTTGYLWLSQHFATQTALDKAERLVVEIVTSIVNDCRYCVAAHSIMAVMHKVDAELVEALRAEKAPADPKLAALARFTRLAASTGGRVDEAELNAFFAAGYTRAQALDVILGITVKTLSNAVDHLTHPAVDQAFSGAAWSPAGP